MKKNLRASKLSFIVVKSEYWKDEFVFIEYPTPAGDYINSRFDTLCHECLFYVKLSPLV